MGFESSIDRPGRGVRSGRCVVAGLLSLVVWGMASGCRLESPVPRPGLRDVEREAVRMLGDVRVHLAGGNVSSERVDLVLDTKVGPLVAGAVFNSATRAWTWRHQMRLVGTVFVDESGAELDLSGVDFGRAIPGTHWVRVDETQVKTKGGLVHRFDPEDGRLVEVRWSDGAYPSLRYVGEAVVGATRTGRVEQCTAATSCTVQLTWSYDESGCIASVVDRAGRRAEYVHDTACRTRVARSAFDVERGLAGRRYEYGGAGRLRAIVTSEGERTELDYAAAAAGANVVAVRRMGAGDPAYRFAYAVDIHGGGTSTVVTTPLGGLWVYEFDAERRLTRRVSPEGDVVALTWSGQRPATRTDAAGETWRFDHVDDDLVRVEAPSGDAVLRTYTPRAVDRSRPAARPIDRIIDGLGVREHRLYNEAGQLVTLVNGAGELTRFEWDELGQLATRTGPDGRETRFGDYGEHGHATRIEQGGLEEIRLFDDVGNLEKGAGLAGELGPGRPGLVRRRFDANRNVVEVVTVETDLVTNAAPVKSTTIERRSDGRPLHITTPYGGEETLLYDALGRLVARRERVDGIDRVTTIESDLEGRPTRAVRPNAMETLLSWDGDGRLARVERRQPGAPSEWLALTYAGGRVVTVEDGAYAAPESIEYDAAGRVRVIDHATGGRTEFVYDARGRETRRRVFDAEYGALLFETTRTWDAAGRLRATRLDGELLVERTYVAGELRSRQLGNGLVRRFDYDLATGKLEATRTELGSGETIEHTTIDRSPCWYDKLCVAVQSAVRLAGPEAGEPVWSTGEEYYQLHWLPTALGDAPNPGSWLRMSSDVPILDLPEGDRVRFDALGNLVAYQKRNGPELEFEFNAEHNRLISGGLDVRHELEHDEAGFVVARDGVPYQWTAGGRLASIGDEVQLEWDARGRPVRRTIGGVTTRYGFGGVVQVDERGWPVAAEIDGVSVALGSTERRYTHADFRGNVLFVTDEHGAPLRRHVYHGFGLRWLVGRDGTQRAPMDGERGFAHGVHLAGIQLMGARPYDPGTGRFLAPDPIDHLLNDFAYTRGNPIRLWDPGGTHAMQIDSARTQSLEGEAAVTVGSGFMALGVAMAGTGVAAGPAGPVAVATGVATFFVGVTLVIIGYGMTAEGPGPENQPPPLGDEEASRFIPPPETASSPCAPDQFRPRRASTRSIVLLAGLALLLATLVLAPEPR